MVTTHDTATLDDVRRYDATLARLREMEGAAIQYRIARGTGQSWCVEQCDRMSDWHAIWAGPLESDARNHLARLLHID